MFDILKLSAIDRLELEKAIIALKERGAMEVYLFGSMARGDIDEFSDWDFAVSGLSGEKLLHVHGILLALLKRETDLISLEEPSLFIEHIMKKKEFVRVA